MRKFNSGGIAAFTVVGLYYLWKNKDKVQDFLDQANIPLHLDDIGSVFANKSIGSKVGSRIQSHRKAV